MTDLERVARGKCPYCLKPRALYDKDFGSPGFYCGDEAHREGGLFDCLAELKHPRATLDAQANREVRGCLAHGLPVCHDCGYDRGFGDAQAQPEPPGLRDWMYEHRTSEPPPHPESDRLDHSVVVTCGGLGLLCMTCGELWELPGQGPQPKGGDATDADPVQSASATPAPSVGSAAGGAAQPGAHCERPSLLWGYGCPEHRGNAFGMSRFPGTCAVPATGIKGHLGAEVCGCKLEPLRIGGEERPNRTALMALFEACHGSSALGWDVTDMVRAALARCEREVGEGGSDA